MLVQLLRPVDDRDLPLRHERTEPEPAGRLAGLLGADVPAIGLAHDDTEVGMRLRGHPDAVATRAAGVVTDRRLAQEARRERVGQQALPDAAAGR